MTVPGDAAHAFADGQITHLSILQNVSGHLSEPPQDHRDSTTWVVRVAESEPEALRLVGELQIFNESWFVFMGVYCAIRVPASVDTDLSDAAHRDELLLTYGPWAVHAMWDFVSVVGRTTAASYPTEDIEIPRVTPDPQYATTSWIEEQHKKNEQRLADMQKQAATSQDDR